MFWSYQASCGINISVPVPNSKNKADPTDWNYNDCE